MNRTRPPSKRLDEVRPGDVLRGTVHRCAHEACDVVFIASASAQFCSDSCRKRARYQRRKEERK